MDLHSKYLLIKNILNFTPDIIPTCSKKPTHYRNKAVFHFHTPIQNQHTSLIAIDIAQKLKGFANSINTNEFKFYGIMIKENYLGHLMLKLLFYSNNSLLNYHNLIINHLLKNITKNITNNIDSISYQITNNVKKNPTKHDPYYHLYGSETIIEKYQINNQSYYIHISPDAFSRINYYEANNIYNKIFQLCHKTSQNNLICLGRDVNIPSLIFNTFFNSTICVTHCPLIYHDLLLNQYHKDIQLYLKEKKDTYLILEKALTTNTTIVTSAGTNGLHTSIIQTINNSNYITQIIYIACNIKSLKRDMDILLHSKYKIETVEITDEFPNTLYTNIIISLIQK